jgi:hypothetical protein
MTRDPAVLRPILVSLTMIGVTIACTCTSSPEPTAAPQPVATSALAPTSPPTEPSTDVPTIEPTATEEPAVILYEDDFSDPGSGWEHYREFDGILDYEDGGYRIGST